MPVRLLIIPILQPVISEEAEQRMKMGGKNQQAVLVVSVCISQGSTGESEAWRMPSTKWFTVGTWRHGGSWVAIWISAASGAGPRTAGGPLGKEAGTSELSRNELSPKDLQTSCFGDRGPTGEDGACHRAK